jgi:CubicO group peptidase (beta-lactamase class C family)
MTLINGSPAHALHIPGLQIAVVRHGRIALLRSYFVANLQTPVPVTDATLISINSTTKAFTGVEAKLVQVGRWTLGRLCPPISKGSRKPGVGSRFASFSRHMSGIPDINNAPGAMSGEASEAAIGRG